jgi:hypothetical protein
MGFFAPAPFAGALVDMQALFCGCSKLFEPSDFRGILGTAAAAQAGQGELQCRLGQHVDHDLAPLFDGQSSRSSIHLLSTRWSIPFHLRKARRPGFGDRLAVNEWNLGVKLSARVRAASACSPGCPRFQLPWL